MPLLVRERPQLYVRNFDATRAEYLVSTAAGPVSGHPVTLVTWFLLRNIDTINRCLLAVGDVGATTRWQLLLGDSGFVNATSIVSGGGASTSSSVNPYAANVWQHAAGVFASSSNRLAYLNGITGTLNTAARNVSAVTGVMLGANFTSGVPGIFFHGALAHTAVYNVALTSMEIAALSSGIVPLMIRPDALVAYWPLDERYSATARDRSASQRFDLRSPGFVVPNAAPDSAGLTQRLQDGTRRQFYVVFVTPASGTTLTPPAVRAEYRASTPVVTTGTLQLPAVRAEYRPSTPALTRSFAAEVIRVEYRASTPVVMAGTLQLPAVRSEYRAHTPQLTQSFAPPAVRAEYRASTPVVTTGTLQLPSVRAEYRASTPVVASGDIRLPAVRAEYRVTTPVLTQGDTVRADAVRAVYAVSASQLTRTLVAESTRGIYAESTPVVTTGVLQLPAVRADYRAQVPEVTRTIVAVAVRAEYRASTPTTEGGGGTTLTPPAVRAEYQASTSQLTRSFLATAVRGEYRVSTPVVSMVVIPQPARAEYRVNVPVVTRTLQAPAVRADYRVVVPALTMTLVAPPSRAEYRVSTPVIGRVLVAQPVTGQYAVLTPLMGRTVLVTPTRGEYATRAPSVTGGGQLRIDAIATRGEYAAQVPIPSLSTPPFTRMAPPVFLKIRQRAEEVILTYE